MVFSRVPVVLCCPAPPWLLGNTRGPCVLQRTEEIATLRESVLRLWSEEGPWPLTLGSRRVFMSLVRQRFFIKDVAPGELVSVNCWGVYQTVRWAAGSWRQSPRLQVQSRTGRSPRGGGW